MYGGQHGAVVVVCACVGWFAAAAHAEQSTTGEQMTTREQAGYSIGYELGRRLLERNIDVPAESVAQGLVDAMGGRDSHLTPADSRAGMDSVEGVPGPTPPSGMKQENVTVLARPAPVPDTETLKMRSDVPAFRPSSYVPDPVSGEVEQSTDASRARRARPMVHTAMSKSADPIEISDLDALLDAN